MDYFIPKLCLLIIGFALTTIAGGILTNFFQKQTWKRQAYLDLFKKKYDEGTKFLDELSELIGKRLFFIQRLAWALSENDHERIERMEKEYFDVVKIWNINYYRNRNKIRLLVNEETADLFLDYTDDALPHNPRSLHYKFVMVHRNVMTLRADNSKRNLSSNNINQLNYSCSRFLEKLTSEFAMRSKRMQLLEIRDLKDNFID